MLHVSKCGHRVSTRTASFLPSANGLFATLLIFSQTGPPQARSGINGTVTDTTGAVVPNAKVTVTNNATNVSRTTNTSSAGSYDITDLIPGVYTVKVEMPGFQASIHNNVGIEVAKSSTVNATLQP